MPLTVIKFPNEILRNKLPEFDFSNPVVDPKTLETDMLETMYLHDGIGLSANQVGVSTRVFVMGHSTVPENSQAYFNPIIIANTDDIEDIEEGCLSFPGLYVKVKRPTAIKARWQNSSGEWQEGEFKGYDCKCFLHELDHLEGIVFKDRVSTLKWALAVKKSQPKRRRK